MCPVLLNFRRAVELREKFYFPHNFITVTLSITTFKTINLTDSNRSRTLLLVLLLRFLNPHISLPFSSLHWLKANKRIEYKLLSLTYKVLTTSKPSYLNLICVQPPRSIRSSSVITLSRPPTISSLKITDCSFRYASPRLWNQLSDSFRQPRQSRLDSPPHSVVSSSLLSSTLSSSITPSLFQSRLKTYLFNKSFPS